MRWGDTLATLGMGATTRATCSGATAALWLGDQFGRAAHSARRSGVRPPHQGPCRQTAADHGVLGGDAGRRQSAQSAASALVAEIRRCADCEVRPAACQPEQDQEGDVPQAS